MQINLPLPPFGSTVEGFQKSSIKLKIPIYLFVGKDAIAEAKKNAELYIPTLCLPFERSLTEYRWPILGQKIILYDTGELSKDTLELMALILLDLGADQVTIYSQDHGLQIFNRTK